MSRRRLAAGLMLIGLAVGIVGYAERSLVGGGARPYAYVSVLAVGAMMVLWGLLLWRDS